MQPGSSVAGFVLERMVHDGLLAAVWRANRGGECFALKIYRPGPHAPPPLRVAREREAQRRVDHPHVARLCDFGRLDGGGAFLASEWVDGVTLAERLAAGALPWREALALAGAIGQGLGAIHAAGIVHRDLKPSNVMLPAGGAPPVKVLDFGHSLVLDAARMTETGKVLGSVAWMAPEQAAGRAIDGRADLYALGAILYRCLTGHDPFEDRAPAEVVRRHQTEPVVPPSRRAPGVEIPRAAEDLCLWLLAKSPEARLPSARVLRVTLGAMRGARERGAKEMR